MNETVSSDIYKQKAKGIFFKYGCSHFHMSFKEKILSPLSPEDKKTVYFGEICETYYAFETGMISAEETLSRLKHIHNKYSVNEWIDEINAKWIGN